MTADEIFDAILQLPPSEVSRLAERLHAPQPGSKDDLLGHLTRGGFTLSSSDERMGELCTIITHMSHLLSKADELFEIYAKRRQPKKRTKYWMAKVHDRRLAGAKWQSVFIKLKTEHGSEFPFNDPESLKQSYSRQKKNHPEWFPPLTN